MRKTIVLLTVIFIALLAGAELEAQHLGDVDQVGRIYNFWGQALDVFVEGEYAYVADGNHGLRVIDVSDPAHPSEVGSYDTPGSPRDLCVSEDDSRNPMSNEFKWYAAFPNPFNSTTTIEYGLPVASLVSLNLYDLSGRLIQTMVEGDHQAGVQTTILNAVELPSGLYFVKLEDESQSINRKIILVR